jgi:hypothetical protein
MNENEKLLPVLHELKTFCESEKEADDMLAFLRLHGINPIEENFGFLNGGEMICVHISQAMSWHNEYQCYKTASKLIGVPIEVSPAEFMSIVTDTLKDFIGIRSWKNLYGWRLYPDVYKKPMEIDGKMIAI